MTAYETLVEAAREARCPHEHTAHNDDGPPRRNWLTCGDTVVAEITWRDARPLASEEVRWWFEAQMEKHRRVEAPRLAVTAVLAALPEVAGDTVAQALFDTCYGGSSGLADHLVDICLDQAHTVTSALAALVPKEPG